MGNTVKFAIVQKERAIPAPDQWKRVFKSFSNLTDADAMRLAVGARGLLMRRLSSDAARALQAAFRDEGIDVAIVSENALPKLPEAQSLHRLELWPQALTVYDPVGHPASFPWNDISVVAAGATPHVQLNKTQTEFVRLLRDNGSRSRLKPTPDSDHSFASAPQFLVELIVGNGARRYEIDATQFHFRRVIDRPGLALEEKFIWLVRQICREAAHADLNHGARGLVAGRETVPAYANRQAFTNEIIWLLWWNERHPSLRTA